MAAIALGYLIFGAILLGTLIFSFAFVTYYSDKYENEFLPTLISSLGLFFTILAVVALPLDVFVLSTFTELSKDEIIQRQHLVENLYTLLYGIIVIFSFGLIPFAYFWYEEEDAEGENPSCFSRAIGAFKYTVFTIVIAIILFVIGIVLRSGSLPKINQSYDKYFADLFVDWTPIEGSIAFIVGCLTLLGSLSMITYTATGLAFMPVNLVKGKKDIREETDEVKESLTFASKQRKALEQKYEFTGRKMKKSDKKQIDDLARRERLLQKKNDVLSKRAVTCQARIETCLTPFAKIFGIAFGFLSFFIMISLLLTQVDKIANSVCGSSCGFILEEAGFNPVDAVLTRLAPIFPIDYIIVVGLIFYFLFTTISGLVRIGVRVGWVDLYSFRVRGTAPQGLLMTVMILMFTLLAVNETLLTLAPQYLAWGAQTYSDDDGKLHPCSPAAPSDICYQSQVSQFYSRMTIKVPIFGLLFYLFNWLLVAVFFLSIAVSLYRRRESNIMGGDLGDSSDSDF